VTPVEVSRAGTDVLIRHTRRSDILDIIELCRLCYPHDIPWTEEQLLAHQRVFPEGQFVAVDRASGRIVGMAASLIVRWDDYDLGTNWQDFTSKGTFANHDPVRGRTLYAAEIMVHPSVRRRGIAGRLYPARRDLVALLGLLRIRAGGRLRGYHRYASTMSAEQYVGAVVSGSLTDPTLSFQLSQGFRAIGVVQHYLEPDPESLGHAAVIEWLNPNAAGAGPAAAVS
jgi:ribosomal protein S18 acetylase RimI-like enzyme